MRFGEYIRNIREKNGWTQPEAAARVPVEQSYLSKMETGKSYPSEDIFSKLVSAYSIDIDKMCNAIFSAELDKLREISDVRSAILIRQKTEQKFMRGWLVAGLIMIMLGGSTLGLSQSLSGHSNTVFLYRSEGIILPGESPMIYHFLNTGRPDAEGKTLTDRIDYDFIETPKNKGGSFIEKVENGHRVYTLYDNKYTEHPSPLSWLLGPGFMLILGGLSCFYISRRWR